MRIRWLALAIAAMFCGALGGVILAPQPADAVSREIIQLQQQVSQLIQGQQDLATALASDTATLRTLVQQSLNSSNQMHTQMGSLQKTVQDMQANTTSTITSMTQQTQGISDNVQDLQARLAKLSQQLNDIQSQLQSVDAKVSGGSAPTGAVAPGGTAPAGPGGPAAMAPISADTLYQNALRDYTSGNYALSRQEFSDYIKHFPQNDLASNAQFYLGEIAYSQGDYKAAIAAYETVLSHYPQSFKLAASLLKKGMAEEKLGMKTSARRDLRDVIRRFPGSDEAHRAQARLRHLERSTSRSRR